MPPFSLFWFGAGVLTVLLFFGIGVLLIGAFMVPWTGDRL